MIALSNSLFARRTVSGGKCDFQNLFCLRRYRKHEPFQRTSDACQRTAVVQV